MVAVGRVRGQVYFQIVPLCNPWVSMPDLAQEVSLVVDRVLYGQATDLVFKVTHIVPKNGRQYKAILSAQLLDHTADELFAHQVWLDVFKPILLHALFELTCERYSPHLGRCLKVEAMPPWLTSGSA